MINLTDYDKFKISYNLASSLVSKVDLSKGSFYAKKCDQDEAFRELIGCYVFDIIGIKCPKYHFIENEKCVISEDLNVLSNFQCIGDISSIKELIKSRKIITLNVVKDLLTNMVNNKDEIALQINLMHFIDMLFSNVDRHIYNYGISIDKNNNGCLVVFDNGLFLDYFDKIVKPPSTINVKYPKVRCGECEFFIKNLSLEHKKIIYEIFCRFTPYNVSLMFDKIEKEYNHKFSFKNKLLINYTRNYFMLYKLINMYINNSIKKSVNIEMSLVKKN